MSRSKTNAKVQDTTPAVGTTATAIVKNDQTIVSFLSIYVGGAGDVKVTTLDGDDVVFSAVPAGMILPIAVTKVWSTGTTASFMVGIN